MPHGWNTAVGLAADLQLASALPGTDLVEYLTGSPYIDDIVAEPWRLDADGMLAIPDRPGLGVALDHNRPLHPRRTAPHRRLIPEAHDRGAQRAAQGAENEVTERVDIRGGQLG